MKKQDRELIFNKTGGYCAYCGEELKKGWHCDHIQAIERKTKAISQHYIHKDTRQVLTSKEIEHPDFAEKWKEYEHVPYKVVVDGCRNPELDNIGNMFAACPSCNINKHGYTIEEFRATIYKYLESLNKRFTQYKMIKKYGLVQETGKPIVFYYETLTTPPTEPNNSHHKTD